ncbi:formate dehydrogenase subunit gamma [Herbaspirillum sp. HC18]|nr:formate dehydrogenase subunit gamma [Herbaspirillum sp. HC18]
MSTPAPFDAAAVRALIAEHAAKPGAMLPVLHAIQNVLGHVPSEAEPLIADALNVSCAEVHGVLSYYHHFRREPAGKHIVRLCRAEACQSVGADALAAHATASLGCEFHETTQDGAFTLEPVYCLGQCACGPAVMIDNDVHARVTNAKLDGLLAVRREEA